MALLRTLFALARLVWGVLSAHGMSLLAWLCLQSAMTVLFSIRYGNQHASNEELLTCIFDSLLYIDEEAELRAVKGEPLTSEEIAGLFYGSILPGG